MNVFELYAKLKLDDSEYEKGLKGALGEAGKIAGKLDKGLNKVLKVGAAAAGAAVAGMTAFAKASVQTGAQFDTAMSQVAATMGTTVDQIQELRDFAQEMGAKTAFSATQAAEALNYMALAGYDAQTSMEMLPTVLNLAAAGSIDLARASDMVTDAQSALGLTLPQTSEMVDQMAAASSKSNTSVAQLGEAFLTIGATARSMKGGTQELATVLGVLADNGIKGAEGGTHLRNMILSLQSPTSDAAKLLSDMNISLYDADGNMRSMIDIIGDLQEGMEGMDQASKDAIAGGIFNKTDLAAVNALLGTSQKRFEELGASIRDSAGAAEQMANTQLDNLNGDITLMQSALEGVKIQFSDGITPAIRNVVQTVTKALSKRSTMKYLNDLGKKLGDVTQILTGKVMNAIPRLLTLFDNGGAKVKAFAAGFTALAIAIKATVNPVGAAITAFGLLAGKMALDALTAEDTSKKFQRLTKVQLEGIEATLDNAEAYKELDKTRSEHIYAIDQETKQTQGLWDELQTLVDANGKVKDGCEDRAKFVTGALAEALGLEISITDGVIEKYNELSGSIQNAIDKKKAMAMMEASEEKFSAAQANIAQARADMYEVRSEIQENQAALAPLIAEQESLYAKIQSSEAAGLAPSEDDLNRYGELTNEIQDRTNALDIANAKYGELESAIDGYVRDIDVHEQALALAEQQRWSELADLLANDSINRYQHMVETGKISQQEIANLKQDAAVANDAVNYYFQKLQEGAEGYNDEGLAKLRESAEELTNLYLKALAESEKDVDDADPDIEIEDNAEDAQSHIQAVDDDLNAMDGKRVTTYIDVVTNQGSGHAGGLDYVPYNNYPAMLHRGESVLTAREADEWRRGEAGRAANTQPIQLTVETPVEMDGQIVAKKIYKFLLNENEFHGGSLINA